MNLNNPQTGCPDCPSIQLIEDGSTIILPPVDPSLEESGSVNLFVDPITDLIHVNFLTPKASDQYRFEYLYVDALGLVNPNDIIPVPVAQSIFGFTVDIGAVKPVGPGYVLRWRVVVFSLVSTGNLDEPETIYVRLPRTNIFMYNLLNPRSSTDYGFDELRVENLADLPDQQAPIWIQVVQKTQVSFTIGLSPTPPTDNYFLSARIPVT